jgi:hypothetical protein
VLTLLDPLTTKVRGWAALARITGEVAERANNLTRAKELYMQAAAAAQTDAERQDLQDRIKRVSNAVPTTIAAPRIPTTQGVAAASVQIPDDLVAPLLRKVGVAGAGMPNAVRVAIIGGAPSDADAGPRIKIVGPTIGAGVDRASSYFTSVMRTVALVAPNVDFVFSQRPTTSVLDIVDALQDVLAERPQVILMPVRGVAGSAIEQLLSSIASQNIVTVLSAGNEGPGKAVPLAGTAALDQIVVVSAVDDGGLPADFTQRDPKSFWAPGVDLPMAGADGISKWSGTGPAAAIAAGVIARVIAEKPGLPLPELLAKLRQGAMPLSPQSGAPPVLNAQRTIGLVQ